MDDGTVRTERVVLLGLVTLLGATVTVITALTALVITIAAAVVVCGLATLLRASDRVSEAVRWALFLTVGFGVSWILGSLAVFLIPVSEKTLLFLQLAGVAPMVYYGAAAPGENRGEVLRSWALFALLLVGSGAFREVFGRGTFFGYLIPTGYAIPADFMASPVGAFLLAGTLVLGARLLSGLRMRTEGGRS